MRVTVENLQRRIRINPAKIEKIANKINAPSKFNNLKLTLYFIKNSIIKKLNKQFFGKNHLTDVISFSLGKNCAEVFIAPLVVKDNAKLFRIEFKQELYRCVVHGILHIFGYKDNLQKEKEKMWRRQERILKNIVIDK